jgi:hypothetical protein
MKLQRWFRDVTRSPASTVGSSVKEADIQREFDHMRGRSRPCARNSASICPERVAAKRSQADETEPAQTSENFAVAPERRPATPARGRPGGLARAREAWRYSDGTFMSENEKEFMTEEYELLEYERYASRWSSESGRS